MHCMEIIEAIYRPQERVLAELHLCDCWLFLQAQNSIDVILLLLLGERSPDAHRCFRSGFEIVAPLSLPFLSDW